MGRRYFEQGARAIHRALAAGSICGCSPHLVEYDRGHFYSTVYAIGPDGLLGKYRATHLWDTERDWATPGDDIPIFRTPFGNVGVMVGYEGMIPEVARVLALRGADLIALADDVEKSGRVSLRGA